MVAFTLRRLVVGVVFFACALSAVAQSFPVRITPTLAPPFSPFLTDLTSPGSTRLLVHVTLTDPTVNNYRCRLRLTIEGVNITITTNPAFNPLPITLNGGVPELFYGSDLVDYFRYHNLLFQGISRSDLERSGGKLPEGIYRFTLEVLDYNRGTVVSNAGTATAWMILNDPPIINTPLTNATITPLNPQNVVFQWTPRHRGSPNAAFTTEYVVRVAEIWPANRNPNDAIATTQPILETVTSNSLFVYSIAETPLVIGRSYALQVQARDTEGRDLFRNNGYSEVVKFTYGEPCPIPTQLTADQLNVAGARMRWNGHSRNSGYRLRYREKAEGAHWFEENLTNSFYTSNGMKPGATYEYEVCGVCQFYESEFTPIQTFATPLVSPTAFVCGNPDVPVPLPVGPPIRQFFTHDTISAAGFSVIVTKVQLNGELLSGEGHAIVPWFNHAKVRVTFKNITVNAKHELLSGTIESVWNPNSKFLLNSSPKTDSISYVRTTVALAEIDTVVSVSGLILTVTTNPDGDIVVQTTEGEVVIPHEEGKTIGIIDQMGNGYVVDAEGHVTKTTADEVARGEERGDREYSSDPNKSIRFIKATNTQYGLDEKRTGTLTSDINKWAITTSPGKRWLQEKRM